MLQKNCEAQSKLLLIEEKAVHRQPPGLLERDMPNILSTRFYQSRLGSQRRDVSDEANVFSDQDAILATHYKHTIINTIKKRT